MAAEPATATLKVSSQTLYTICQALTGYGKIDGITAEGEIFWTVEAEDAFALGRMAAEVEKELEAYDTGVVVEKVIVG